MSAHDEYMTKRQARDLARRLARLERKTRSTAAAHADLRHSALDGGARIPVKDEHGNTTAYVGAGPTGIEHVAGPVPARPAPVFVDAGQRVVKFQHSGLDVDEDPAPADFKHAEVHVSQEQDFDPSLSTYAVNLDTANGSVTHSLPAGEWWVGIVWVTLSGQRSPMSEPVLADIEPPVGAQDIQDTLDAAQEALDEYRDNVATPRFQALESGLSENNDNLENARTRLSAAEQTLSPLPGRIESAEQDVATAQAEATKAAAAAVEANNRAMTRLANGNFESGLDYWSHSNVELTSTAHSGQQAALVEGWLRPASSFPVVPDQIWELSLYYQYDVTVTFETVDGDQRTVLSTHHLDGDSTWSDSGALRVTIPADVHMLSFTITGTSAIVDDITLRDVTDVVRLEQAANANRQKAEQAISELAVLQLAVDGEGGLKDRLDSAEDDLENIDTELDQVATNLTTALTGPVDHTRLRAGEGAFDTGFIGELWAGNIRALAAELASLIVASPNMIPNGDLTQGDDFWTLSNAQLVTDDTPPGYEHAIRRMPNDGLVSHNVRFPVQGGEEYLWEMWIKADKPDSRFFWDMRDQNGTHVGSNGGSTKALEPEGHNPAQRPVTSLIVPTEWTRVRTVLRPSQNVTHLYMAAMYFNHSVGTERDATISVGGVRMTPRAGAEVLVDGSVTAEKIHATRELITKIMGAEWAYIAQQLIVDGKILTRDLEALSAAIQSLTVTQRADIAQLWAEELWTALAVIKKLQAEEAWITSAMISELTAEKVTVTENFVGRVAELLHLVVDRIDANTLWADQTWQAAGHFGSEGADQKTEVDGTGVTLYRKIEGEFIPAAVFGGGDVRLAFFDNNEATGAITQDGHISGQEANFQQYHWQGRPLFGTALPEGNEPVLDSVSQRFAHRNQRVMNGAIDGANQYEYGFLPLSFHATAGMTYEILVPGLRLWNINEAVILAELHYNTDNRPAVLSDPVLGREAVATTTNIGTQKILPEFTRFFHCEEDCEVNLLLAVRAENGNPVPRWWHSVTSEASTAELWVRPVGVTPEITGGTRDVYVGHPDLGGGEKSYLTGWTPTWHQAYVGTQKYTGSSKRLLHGYDEASGQRYATHFGGYRNSPGYAGSGGDAGLTINQATSGAFITNGTLTLTGAASTNTSGMVWVQWHTLTSAPETFVSQYDTRLIQSVQVSAGQRSVIDLPRVVLDAIAADTFEGFTLHHPTTDQPWVSAHSQQSTTSRPQQPMMRLRYVR